jgi:xanthine dehydrogenase iron-sulfur cluster and FAD-binding subunit A
MQDAGASPQSRDHARRTIPGRTGIADLIEILRLRGGGTGLFTGCADGDTGAAVVLRVDE